MANITAINVFDADDYSRAVAAEVRDSNLSNDIWPYVRKAEVHERLRYPAKLTLDVVGGSEWNTDFLIKSRHRVYVTYSDATVVPYRVKTVRFDANSGDVKVVCEHLWNDLKDLHLAYRRQFESPDSYLTSLRFPFARMTVDAALDIIFDAEFGCPSLFAKGTVDAAFSSTEIALNSNGSSFLDLIKSISDQISGGFEFSTSYAAGDPGTLTFNFEPTVGTQTTPSDRPVGSSKGNRFKLTVDDSQDNMFTRVIPFAGSGDEAVGLGDEGWLYCSANGSNPSPAYYTFTVVGSPFPFDDIYTENTDYWLEIFTEALQEEQRTDLRIDTINSTTGVIQTTDQGAGGVGNNTVIKLRIHFDGGPNNDRLVSYVNRYTSHEDTKGIVEKVIRYNDVSPHDNLFEVLTADGSPDMSTGVTDGDGNYVPNGMNLSTYIKNAKLLNIEYNTPSASHHRFTIEGDHTAEIKDNDSFTIVNVGDGWNGTHTVDGDSTLTGSDTYVIIDSAVSATESNPGPFNPNEYAEWSVTLASSSTSDSNRVNNGTASMKVSGDNGATIETDSIPIYSTQELPYVSVWAATSVEAGKVAMRLVRVSDDFQDIDDATYSGIDIVGMALDNSAICPPGSTTNVKVVFECLEDGTIFHLDALTVVQNRGTDHVPLQQYMGAAGLMERAGIDLVKDGGVLLPAYTSEFYDLDYDDPGTYDEIHLGCTVELKDLPITGGHAIDETPRVVELIAVESHNGQPIKRIRIDREKPKLDRRLTLGHVELTTKPYTKPALPTKGASIVGDLGDADASADYRILHDPTRGGVFRYNPSGLGPHADGVISFASNDGRTMDRVFSGPYSASWGGAVADGVTDDSSAIQAVLDACRDHGGGTVVFEAGTYYIGSTTLTVHGNPTHEGQGPVQIDMLANAKIVYDGTGTAIKFLECNQTVHTLYVERDAPDWYGGSDTTSIGIEIVNCLWSTFNIVTVRYFETGIKLLGDITQSPTAGAAGTAHCTFNLGTIRDNGRGIVNIGGPDYNTSFSNQNNFNGGTISQTSLVSPTQAGTRYLDFSDSGNNNMFHNVSMEGNVVEIAVDIASANNMFLNCRYEALGTGKFRFLADSHSNFVIGGYDNWGEDGDLFDDQSTSNISGNVIWGNKQGPTFYGDHGTFAGPCLRLQPLSSSATRQIVFHDIAGLVRGYVDGAGDMYIFGTAGEYDATDNPGGETVARFKLQAADGSMRWSDGSAALTRLLVPVGGGAIMRADETWQLMKLSQSTYNNNTAAQAAPLDTTRVYQNPDGFVRMVKSGTINTFTVYEDSFDFSGTGTAVLKDVTVDDELIRIDCATGNNSTVQFYENGVLKGYFRWRGSAGQFELYDGTATSLISKDGKIGINAQPTASDELYVNGDGRFVGNCRISGRTYVDGELDFGTESLTISSGSVTQTKAWIKVRTETIGVDDDLTTVSTSGGAGQFLIIEWDSTSAADITIKESGNLEIEGNQTEMVLNSGNRFALAIFDSISQWRVLSFDGEVTLTGTQTLTNKTLTSSTNKFRFSKSFSIANPGASEDRTLFHTDKAITITQVSMVLVGSATPSVTLNLVHNVDRSAVGSNLWTTDEVITTTTTDDTGAAFNDASVLADSFVWLETQAQSGTVEELHLTIYYDED